MGIPFYVVNAFTDKPFKGNPAGVVLDADRLDKKTMQDIAAEIRCSETAFVMGSDTADFKVRFFSPLREVNLCGHATIATFHAMAEMGFVRADKLTMETKAGILGVEIRKDGVFMEQSNPVFREAGIDRVEIASALNVNVEEFSDLPVEAVSTGLFSLNIPIDRLATIKGMKPDFNRVKKVCKKSGVGSLFVFTFETLSNECFVHARCFAPLYGVDEDPVTGTANAALGAYLRKHSLLEKDVYKSEQGYEMGKEGTVVVDVSGDKVKVGGMAYVAMQGTLDV